MMRDRPLLRRAWLPGLIAAFVALPSFAPAQEVQPASRRVDPTIEAARAILAAESYITPAPAIERLVTAPRHLTVQLTQPSPDRRHFLKQESEGLPGLAGFGKPHYNLAGLQIDPRGNRARALTTRGASGLSLIDATTGESTTIPAPAGATITGSSWSPDGSQLAFIANFDAGSHLYVADVATGRSRQVTRTALLATLVTGVSWTADGRYLVTVLLPDGRGPEPGRPALATGPQVRVWLDSVRSPQRNFASLLEEPFDQDLLEYFVTGQLARIDVRTRAVRKIGAPAMFAGVDVSPDGRTFRVTVMQRPFSYMVQHTAFGRVEALWDDEGRVLAEIENRPLREVPDTTAGGPGAQAAREGAKRGLDWMPDGQGMYYLEPVPRPRRNADSTEVGAPPQGAGQGQAAARADRLVQWLPPFGPDDTRVLYTSDGPISSVLFSDDAGLVFLASTRSGTGEITAVRLSEPERKYTIVRQRGYTPSFQGRGGFGGGFGGQGGAQADTLAFYQNPGAMMTRRGTLGGLVAMISSDSAVYLTGTRYVRNWEEEAPRPFVDKVSIATGDKTRRYEGAGDVHEALTAALDDDFTRAVVQRESPTAVPDSWLRDLRTGTLTRLTANTDPAPEFSSLVRKRVWVTRADGVRFLVRLTLPADYREGTRLPGMFWFYPREYTDQAGYERTLRTEDINRFPSSGPRTIEFLATQGYAVANFNPPIMGETGRMNDNYVADLRMNVTAVIDELDRQGYIDRARLGIGGHSYGAFSTANAMVHTPFFKAGIAGNGMYNRTLTPNGFQSERRNLWSGQRTYMEMSPMLYVERLQGALLLYHSLEDQNVGTAPISSIRMMQALRAHGKTAAMYLYPYEDHGPAARETLLDQWARWTAWLDLYVKNGGRPETRPVATEEALSTRP